MSARSAEPPVCTPIPQQTKSFPFKTTPHHPETPQSSQNADVIRVRNLLLLAHVADGAQWPSPTSTPVRQPVRVSIDVPHDLRCAASRDDISKSINYGTLSKRVLASVDAEHPSAPPPTFRSLEQLADHIFRACFGAFPEPRALPYADAVRVRSSRTRDGDGAWSTVPDRLSIERLACNLVVGLNPCEREDRQLVCFDVDISTALEPESAFDFRRLAKDIRQEVESSEFVSLEALASLVARITLRHANRPNDVVTVRAAKPKALVFADAAEVEIIRTSLDYPDATSVEVSTPESPSYGLDPPVGTSTLRLLSLSQDLVPDRGSPPQGEHLAAIALGSNLGDRFANIEAALQLLEHPELISAPREQRVSTNLTVVNTSFLYETAPMYVTDQPSFLNCACIVRTTLTPLTVLEILKSIERAVGRVPSIRNGPRAIDLDVLFYNDACIDTRPRPFRGTLEGLEGHLVIPHPRMAEREFVLRPLCDMVPDFAHPVSRKPIHEMLSDVLKESPVGSPAMIKVMPFPKYPHSSLHNPPVAHVPTIPHTQTHWTFPPAKPTVPAGRTSPRCPRRTRLMAILNVTPDSFSDGSDHTALPAALAYVASSTAAGADIVDVGGYSTRPGAAYVSSHEEANRVLSVIRAIRDPPPPAAPARDVLLSVDTFRPDVARAAVLAGANCINDVHAFTGPDYPPASASALAYLAEMKETARELAVPVVLMHSRGDAGANKDYSQYGSVVQGVAQELGEKVEAIVRGPGGVRRWLVMVDPGIGFSKSLEGNLQVLRDCGSITAKPRTEDGAWNPLRGYPQLVGVSRKSFLGAILSQPDEGGTYQGRQTAPKERGWATAAAVTGAVQQGAAVVRVHDVHELSDVVRVADSIFN
ncbi:Dihydropteroate synthase-like protein [Russula brevipes]|nr:Dihydropteroate synthase-like protein [Russula brevipes]